MGGEWRNKEVIKLYCGLGEWNTGRETCVLTVNSCIYATNKVKIHMNKVKIHCQKFALWLGIEYQNSTFTVTIVFIS